MTTALLNPLSLDFRTVVAFTGQVAVPTALFAGCWGWYCWQEIGGEIDFEAEEIELPPTEWIAEEEVFRPPTPVQPDEEIQVAENEEAKAIWQGFGCYLRSEKLATIMPALPPATWEMAAAATGVKDEQAFAHTTYLLADAIKTTHGQACKGQSAFANEVCRKVKLRADQLLTWLSLPGNAPARIERVHDAIDHVYSQMRTAVNANELRIPHPHELNELNGMMLAIMRYGAPLLHDLAHGSNPLIYTWLREHNIEPNIDIEPTQPGTWVWLKQTAGLKIAKNIVWRKVPNDEEMIARETAMRKRLIEVELADEPDKLAAWNTAHTSAAALDNLASQRETIASFQRLLRDPMNDPMVEVRRAITNLRRQLIEVVFECVEDHKDHPLFQLAWPHVEKMTGGVEQQVLLELAADLAPFVRKNPHYLASLAELRTLYSDPAVADSFFEHSFPAIAWGDHFLQRLGNV